MNTGDFYVVGIAICAFLLLSISYIAWMTHDVCKKKYLVLYYISMVLFAGIIVYCYIKNNAAYKEVYYLEYTVYYPGNTCKFKVDSCNHVYASSDRGTNHIRYYSIPKKDTYGTDTTAPIVIDKIIKK